MKSGPGALAPRPYVLQWILQNHRIYKKTLVQIAADPGKIMTLATGVRHNVEVATFRWIGVLEDRALAGPDDVKDVGCYVTLSDSALPILVEVQVVLSIDVDVL